MKVVGMMKMDVSGMSYVDLEKAFDSARWAVQRIARVGDTIVLECSRNAVS